jgi:3-oxoadipate enol-lactonase
MAEHEHPRHLVVHENDPTETTHDAADGRIVPLAGRGELFVRVNAGAHGPAVVLLHGLAASADLNWSEAVPYLRPRYRVVAPDLRGHGRTRACSNPFTLEDAADDVAALAEALALGPFIAVGYSMGGAIAQLLVRRHPHLVTALVLCATSRSFRRTFRERAMFAALPPARVLARALPDEVARTTARRLAARVVGESPDRGLEQFGRSFDARRVLGAAAALGDFDSSAWVGSLHVPTAVLVHLRDQLVSPRSQFALAHAIPRCAVHAVEGDHFAAARRPDAFAATLKRAIRGVHRRAISESSDRSAGPATRSVWTA